jgi:hypothetical protein
VKVFGFMIEPRQIQTRIGIYAKLGLSAPQLLTPLNFKSRNLPD